MDANTKNRFRIYKDEQEHKEMFYQKMRVREDDLRRVVFLYDDDARPVGAIFYARMAEAWLAKPTSVPG